MNPLLLGLLAAGAAYVLLRKPSCPTQPTQNPFFGAANSIDWDALQKSLGKSINADMQRTQAWIQFAQAAGSASAKLGLGWYGAAVAVAANVLNRIAAAWADDDNSDKYKLDAQKYASQLIALGFIPVTYDKGATFHSLRDANVYRMNAITSQTGFGRSLIEYGGQSFAKWGGYGPVAVLAAPTLFETHLGNAPSAGDLNAKVDHQSLLSICASVAYDMGVCDRMNEVINASLAAYDACSSDPFQYYDKEGQYSKIDLSFSGLGPCCYAVAVWTAIDKSAQLAGRSRPVPFTFGVENSYSPDDKAFLAWNDPQLAAKYAQSLQAARQAASAASLKTVATSVGTFKPAKFM